MIYGNFKTKSGFVHPETLDGVKFAPYGWKSAYIEGKGQYYDPESGIVASYGWKSAYIEGKGQYYDPE